MYTKHKVCVCGHVCTYMHMYNPVCMHACSYVFYLVCVSAVCMCVVDYCKVKPVSAAMGQILLRTFMVHTAISLYYCIYIHFHTSILSFSESCISEVLRMVLLIQLCTYIICVLKGKSYIQWALPLHDPVRNPYSASPKIPYWEL